MVQIQGVRVKNLWKKVFHMSLSDTYCSDKDVVSPDVLIC